MRSERSATRTTRFIALSSAVVVISLAAVGCSAPVESGKREGSGSVVLKPLASVDDSAEEVSAQVRQVVYVPIYSSIYWGFNEQILDLAVTLSIRNVSLDHAITIESAMYYDSEGRAIENFVEKTSSLDPMATADFVIARHDTAGGPGANVLVIWSGSVEVDEPVIEAVMVGSHGNVGVSFTGVGRVLPKASAALSASPDGP